MLQLPPPLAAEAGEPLSPAFSSLANTARTSGEAAESASPGNIARTTHGGAEAIGGRAPPRAHRKLRPSPFVLPLHFLPSGAAAARRYSEADARASGSEGESEGGSTRGSGAGVGDRLPGSTRQRSLRASQPLPPAHARGEPGAHRPPRVLRDSARRSGALGVTTAPSLPFTDPAITAPVAAAQSPANAAQALVVEGVPEPVSGAGAELLLSARQRGAEMARQEAAVAEEAALSQLARAAEAKQARRLARIEEARRRQELKAVVRPCVSPS